MDKVSDKKDVQEEEPKQEEITLSNKSSPRTTQPSEQIKEEKPPSPSLRSQTGGSKLLNTQQNNNEVGTVVREPKSHKEVTAYIKNHKQEDLKLKEEVVIYQMLKQTTNAEAQQLPARSRHSASKVSALLLASLDGENTEHFEDKKIECTKQLIKQCLDILEIEQPAENENQEHDIHLLSEKAQYLSSQLQEQLENEFWAPQTNSVISILISKIIAIATGISRLKLNMGQANTLNSQFTSTLLSELPEDCALIIQDINGEELYPYSFIDAYSTENKCFSSRFAVGKKQTKNVSTIISQNDIKGRSPRALVELLSSQGPVESGNAIDQMTKQEALNRFPWIRFNLDEEHKKDKEIYNIITRNSKGGFFNIFTSFAPNESKDWGKLIIPQNIKSLAHYGNFTPVIRRPDILVQLQLTRCVCPDLSQLNNLKVLGLSYVKGINPQQLEELRQLNIFFACNVSIAGSSNVTSTINSPSMSQSRLAYGPQIINQNQELTKSQLDSSKLQNSNYTDMSKNQYSADLLTYLYRLPYLKRIEIYNCQLCQNLQINTMPTGSQTSSLTNYDILQSLEVLILRYNAGLRNVLIRVGDGALKKLKTIDTTAKLTIENMDKLKALEYTYSKNRYDQELF